ncbi:MAG: class I SAM-dependent methyltransferase [Myxococcales bacterium]|nr:class I SAM-dependent methyltransferase [Myxococcales bacterium]MCB9669929.1 class I SAM-dependent methyltransferase [Alphaproteobacteria bacterium]MCB9693197.1 class I SAM-dependent methyltransferase [Alphaproteobacteria bacterium]
MPEDLPELDGIGTRGEHLLTTHARLLERWRKAMNLVGPGPIAAHYEDANRALKGFRPSPGRWVDLGTGAGFPGIVFAAMHPDLPLELVDSRQKRTRFLEEVLAEADWQGVDVLCTRHETLPEGAYAGVMSRALHAPERMVEVARRLLVPGGTLLLFLQDDAPIPTDIDLEVFHVEHYVVDGRPRKLAASRLGSPVR